MDYKNNMNDDKLKELIEKGKKIIDSAFYALPKFVDDAIITDYEKNNPTQYVQQEFYSKKPCLSWGEAEKHFSTARWEDDESVLMYNHNVVGGTFKTRDSNEVKKGAIIMLQVVYDRLKDDPNWESLKGKLGL